MRTAAQVKWDGSAPYFEHRIPEMLSPSDDRTEISWGTAFCVYGPMNLIGFPMRDTWLVEAVAYEDGMMHVMGIRKLGSEALPSTRNAFEPHGAISVALLCSESEPYRSQLVEAVHHYASIPAVGEICIAYYGEKPPYGSPLFFNNTKIHGMRFPMSEFSMAKGRNAAIAMCAYARVLVSDLDYRFTEEQLEDLSRMLDVEPDVRVYNLKSSPSAGNGNYFGTRRAMWLNTYDERFVRCWREDTEYLMNFSRIGILPKVIIRPDYYHPAQDHVREETMPYQDANFELMKRIIWYGR